MTLVNRYVEMAMEANMCLEMDFTNDLDELMTMESNFICTCMEMGEIVMEKMEVEEKDVEVKKNFFERLLDAILMIFGAFTEKVQIILDRNDKWLKENLESITAEQLAKIDKITIHPSYEKTSNFVMQKMEEMLSLVDFNKNRGNKKAIEQYADYDNMKKLFAKYTYNDNLAEGMKNYMRHGSPTPKDSIEISGSKLAAKFGDIKTYLLEYDKIVVPKMKNRIKALQNDTKKLQREVEAELKSVKESFCYIENCSYTDTQLAYLPNRLDVLLEAGEEEKKQSTTTVDVKIDDSNEGKEAGEGTKSNTDVEFGKKLQSYLKNCIQVMSIIYGAAFSVFEEKYLMYINICKKVVSVTTGEKKAKDGENTEGEGEEGKEQESKSSPTEDMKKKPEKNKKKESYIEKGRKALDGLVSKVKGKGNKDKK